MNIDDKITSLRSASVSLQTVAKELGVSRQRVHELLLRRPDVHASRIADKIAKKKAREEKSMTAYKKRHSGLTKKQMEDPLVAEQVLRLSKKKSEAVRRGIEFAITWEDVDWPTHCPIFGTELNYFSDSSCDRLLAPSIDRIDPKKGYVPGNVAVISYRANRIKNDGSAEDHRKIAEYIDKRLNYS